MAERASTSAKKLTDDSAPATFSSAQKTFWEEPPERRNSRGPLWAASIGLGEPTEAAPGPQRKLMSGNTGPLVWT